MVASRDFSATTASLAVSLDSRASLNWALRWAHRARKRSDPTTREIVWGWRPSRFAVSLIEVPGFARISSIMESYQSMLLVGFQPVRPSEDRTPGGGPEVGVTAATSAKKLAGSSVGSVCWFILPP